MESFKKWIGNSRLTVVVFGVLTLICYLIPMVIEFPIISFVCLILTLVFPFLIGVCLLTGNEYYKSLVEHAWFRAVKRLLLVAYTIFAGVWAANEINEVFLIGASNFPITVLIYTMVYVLVAYIKPVAAYLSILNYILCSFVVLALFLKPSLFKKLWIYFMFVLLLSATAANISRLEKNKFVFIPKIAVFSDFSSKYRCKKDLLGHNAKSVIFLSDGNVFVHYESIQEKNVLWSFDIRPCEI